LGLKHEESTELAICAKISQNAPKVASEIEILCFRPFGKQQKNIIVAIQFPEVCERPQRGLARHHIVGLA
jgi:hypothetical protein